MKSIIASTLLILPGLFTLQSCGEQATEEKDVVYKPLVEIEQADIKDFTHQIRVQGNVETDKDVTLSAEMGGLITSIGVKEGDKVRKGDIIAQVDASVLSSNMNELKTQLEYAEYMLDKQQKLVDKGVGSEFDLETAKNQVNSLKASMRSLSTQQGKATIRAPFAGIVDQVFARKGQMAGPSAPLVRLVNNDKVDIIASISEKHFSKVRIGTIMNVSFPNYADTTITLKVNHVGNYIEPTNRTFRIKASIDDNNYFLPNMLAEVSITDLNVKDDLVIPSKSILKDQDNNDYVFVAKKHKKEGDKQLYQVSKVIVNIIERFEGEALIKQNGIEKGTAVVVKGARGVTDNEIVRID